MKAIPASKRSSRKPTTPTEGDAEKRTRAHAILRRLRKEFPGAVTALSHENPFQLLIATILSAQCTDERVNMVTPGLFRKYPIPAALASANQSELEREIRSTGFFRMKARNIIACSKAISDRYNGKLPETIEELVTLPGVGRKTANVVLGQAFGVASGVVVDTHVHRLSQRMGFTIADDPVKIEQDLMSVFPKKNWIELGTVMILHGRKRCNARKPKCIECAISDLCPSASLFLGSGKGKG